MQIHFKIVHMTGIEHQAVGGLSRLPTNGSDLTVLEDDLPFMVDSRSNKPAFNSSSIDADDDSHAELSSTFGKNSATIFEFFNAQRTNTYYNEVRHYIVLPNNAFIYVKDGTLMKFAPADGAIETVMPRSLRTGI